MSRLDEVWYHQVDIEKNDNTYRLDYYGDDEPRGYPNEEFPYEWDAALEEYPLDRYPDYREGTTPDSFELQKYCLLDEIEAISGKRWGGQQGIGRLKEVGLSIPNDVEGNPIWDRDNVFFNIERVPDLDEFREGFYEYKEALEDEGITVHTFEMPQLGAYGPMRKTYAAEPMVLREGAILPRFGIGSYKRGSSIGYQKFFSEIDCPVIHTVSGYGIMETGSSVSVGENALVIPKGLSGNQDGVDQLLPVFARSGIKEVHAMELQHWGRALKTGTMHPSMCIAAVDTNIALVHPQFLTYSTKRYLEKRDFEFVEIVPEEHDEYYPTTGLILEPGKVMMDTGPTETIRRLEKAGVEVVNQELPTKHPGGITQLHRPHCVTIELVREEGPSIPLPDKI